MKIRNLRPLFILITSVLLFSCAYSRKLPNFVFILTDDQDSVLGGMTPMAKTRKIIAEQGAEFQNMFVTSPLCCPSRASIFSGRYSHNHGVMNNSLSGNCSSQFWQTHGENNAFITYIKSLGYETFYAGKYLNQYGHSASGGISHIPRGWDHWIGLVGNSRYYNYTLSVNGKAEWHGDNATKDYLTDVLFHRAAKFLKAYSSKKPFFMMVSPPAPHSPFTPAFAHKKAYHNISAPRTPNFHIPPSKTKHWLLRQPPFPLPRSVIAAIDETHRNRWCTLLSVDDGIEKLYKILLKKRLLLNTYLVFSSDNGFHLGQFSLPWDKRQLYEFDIRVPLFMRGPSIKPGLKIEAPVLNIDLAPTFLSLVGIKPPKLMDGLSFSHLFKSSGANLRGRKFLIEHVGESSQKPILQCPQYKIREVNTCDIDCICEDSLNNTYSCLRIISGSENEIYCHFQDTEDFVEIYNLTSDPYQLRNLYFENLGHLHASKHELKKLSECHGISCNV